MGRKYNELVVGAPDAAESNTAWLTAQLAANETSCPKLPDYGTVFVSGTASTRPVVGCGRLKTDAAGGYSIDPHATLGGSRLRFVQLGKGPILRLTTGFVVNDPIEWVGDGESACIEIEGRRSPATGRNRFRDQLFRNAGAAIRCLGGYYEGDKFVADENHADNSIMDGCEAFNCDRFFWSQNQQGVNWVLRECAINSLGPKNCIFADIERGGHLALENPVVNHPRSTIFRVRDYSPNNCTLICNNLHVDRSTDAEYYCCLFDYAGDPAAVRWWMQWAVRISGSAATHDTKIDRNRNYRVPGNLPREEWDIRVKGLTH